MLDFDLIPAGDQTQIQTQHFISTRKTKTIQRAEMNLIKIKLNHRIICVHSNPSIWSIPDVLNQLISIYLNLISKKNLRQFLAPKCAYVYSFFFTLHNVKGKKLFKI